MAKFAPRPLDEQLCFTLYATSMAVTRMYKPMLDRMGTPVESFGDSTAPLDIS